MPTYRIKRFFFEGEPKIVKKGLTLKEAQDHCNDPESCSDTCTKKAGIRLTEKRGKWFDGYEEEVNHG